MRLPILIFTLTAGITANHAFACSFGPGYEIGRPPSPVFERLENARYAPPTLAPSLKRGFDDGNYASCSDAGVLTLSLGEHIDPTVSGYEFRVVSGEFPLGVEFPEYPVKPIRLSDNEYGFRFVWLDLPPNRSVLEPIEVRIEIRRQSTRGEVSRPLIIAIEHRGGLFRNRRPATFEIYFEQPIE